MSDLAEIFGDAFDVSEHEPMGDFTVVPPGKYPVEISEASVNLTKKGDGHYIKLRLTILDGEYRGCPLYDNLNVDNPNEMARTIARRVLTSILQSLGREKIKDSAELIGGKLTAHVKVKDDQNQIRTYSKLEKAVVDPRVDVNSQSNAPVADSKIAKMPWDR